MRKVWERELFFLCYYIIGGSMKTTSVNSFDKTLKYKLYRTVYEIIHPTISKKNISSYRIVFNDEVLPVRVFYPKKVSNISKVIIYIPGFGEVSGCLGGYSEIIKNIAYETEELVIALDLDDLEEFNYLEVFDKCFASFSYLSLELEKLGIASSNITLMGDSVGATLALSIIKKSRNKDNKLVLFYPILANSFAKKKTKELENDFTKKLEKFYKKYLDSKKLKGNKDVLLTLEDVSTIQNNMLFMVGNADPLKDEVLKFYEAFSNNENNKLVELEFCGHGFLDEMDEVLLNEVAKEIIAFLK